jgi:hypothetical protein
MVLLLERDCIGDTNEIVLEMNASSVAHTP